MNIFIGSSKEAIEVLDWVAMCLEQYGHRPLRWDQPGLFPPGEQTFARLISISQSVDGAIFIFSEDDQIWYRGDAASQPRDNVLIEYGLFAGRLGLGRAIICMYQKPKQATDMLGINYVDVSEPRRERARIELRIWANDLSSEKADPATLQLKAKLVEQERKVEVLEQQLAFEADKGSELEVLLSERGILDFQGYDLSSDGHWKLLFDFDYFWAASQEIAKYCATPGVLRHELNAKGAEAITRIISWTGSESDTTRTAFFTRKALRLMRRHFKAEAYRELVTSTDPSLRQTLERIAQDVIVRKVISDSRTLT